MYGSEGFKHLLCCQAKGSWKLKVIIALPSLRHSKMTMCFVSPYQKRIFPKVRYNSYSPSDKYQVTPTPRCPKLLKSQKTLHMRESLIGRYLQLVSPWAKNHLGRTGTDVEKLLSSQQNRKVSMLLYGLEVAAPPPTHSSCELHFPSWSLRGALVPPPPHLVGPGATYQREVIQEKTNLLIRSIISVAWRSGRAHGSTRHAARSDVEGLRVGVNL